jgi:hypothetical protein
MWCGVDPASMCDGHLLGEHSELHQEVGTLLRHPHGEAVVGGHVSELQFVPARLESRHRRLVEEMERRGMDHDSPLEECDEEWPEPPEHSRTVLQAVNMADLDERCPDCEPEAGPVAGGR